MQDGGFWSPDMNSFNHYAYGAVADWIYSVAVGINVCEDSPGYARVRLTPHPTEKLDWLEGRLDTRHGRIHVKWSKQEKFWRCEIETPVEAEAVIGSQCRMLRPGRYILYQDRE